MHENPIFLGFNPDKTWELVSQPAKRDELFWRYNANKPLMGKYYYRWRRAEFSWVVMPGIDPLVAPENVDQHEFKGCFSVSERDRRELRVGKFLKLPKKNKDLVIAGWDDYRWQENSIDEYNPTRRVELPDHDKWEYFAVPIVEKIVISWGWKHEMTGKWFSELVFKILNLMFTERGMGLKLSSATFSDEPLYLGADFAVYRRPR